MSRIHSNFVFGSGKIYNIGKMLQVIFVVFSPIPSSRNVCFSVWGHGGFDFQVASEIFLGSSVQVSRQLLKYHSNSVTVLVVVTKRITQTYENADPCCMSSLWIRGCKRMLSLHYERYIVLISNIHYSYINNIFQLRLINFMFLNNVAYKSKTEIFMV